MKILMKDKGRGKIRRKPSDHNAVLTAMKGEREGRIGWETFRPQHSSEKSLAVAMGLPVRSPFCVRQK